jgi:DtxR family transcriptional regulator, Mn-dependent transcriptional regulator
MVDISQSFEDYLEVIYLLCKNNDSNNAKTIDIAKKLNVKLPSVTEMVKKLKIAGLVESESYGPINLTEIGMKKAKIVYDRHKTLTTFFMLLGVDEITATKDACHAEHILSKKTITKIKQFVNNN